MSHAWLWPGLIAAGLAMFFRLTHDALRHFSRARLEEELDDRERRGELLGLFTYHEELNRTTAVLYGLSLTVMTVLVLRWGTTLLGPGWRGWLLGVVVAVGLMLTVGGTIPMAWARFAAEGVILRTLPLLHACRRLAWPLAAAGRPIESVTRRLLGIPADAGAASAIEEEIRSVVSEGEREGAIEEDQRDMIESVIEFKKEHVTEIMTPRTDVISVEATASPEAARQLIAESGHSRIPVTDGNIDTIVGILYAKDLLQRIGDPDAGRLHVRDVMREALFVPETKKLDELQTEFRTWKVHIAIVVDEYGGTAGLVTIEDIIEEVFGDIIDEYEEEAPQPIRRIEDRAYAVEARVHIDELNHELDLDLPEEEDYETIGGFVLSRLGTIPKPGEVLQHRGCRITVLEADERRIRRVRIDLGAAAGAPEA